MSLDAIDRKLIAATQGGLPLTPAPYAEVASWLGLSEDEVIARMSAMQDARHHPPHCAGAQSLCAGHDGQWHERVGCR